MNRMFFQKIQDQKLDMEQEEEHYILMASQKIYPFGLFNLVSSQRFFAMTEERRRKAVDHALIGEVLKGTVFYDSCNEVVYFKSKSQMLHKCDLRRMQVAIVREEGVE